EVALDHVDPVAAQVGGERRQREMGHARRPVRREKEHDFHGLAARWVTSPTGRGSVRGSITSTRLDESKCPGGAGPSPVPRPVGKGAHAGTPCKCSSSALWLDTR